MAAVLQRQSDLRSTGAAVVQRQSELELARKSLQRSQALFEQQLIPRQKLDEDLGTERAARAALSEAQAQRQAAEAALTAARIDVDFRDAAIDRDQSPESRDYLQSIAGSYYFVERPPIRGPAELDRRLRSGELALAIEIPPGFGRDLTRGRSPEVGVWVDGSMPFRAETVRGYVQGIHYDYLTDLAVRGPAPVPGAAGADLEVRYRYNQDFRSLHAMVPAVIPLLLLLIPAILAVLAVVREKELGSITNLYVTPVTRLEFLLGKQLPYVGFAMISFFGLVALAVFVLGVPLKGSLLALTAGALLYVVTTTGLGLLMSAFTRTQIAALAGTAIVTMVPAIQFSGLTDPVSSLEGAGRAVGNAYPMTYFLIISRGTFNKALGFGDLSGQFLALAVFIPVVTLLCLALLRKQGR